MVTPTMVTTGIAGSFLRRPIGGAVIDQWTWVPKHETRATHRLLGVYLDGGNEIWIVPTDMDALQHHALWTCEAPEDHQVVRDMCRHLARMAAKGGLTMPPTGKCDRRVWTAAGGFIEAFIERFGTLDRMEREGREAR